ncbi:hypothetical protein VTO73DRAFT_15541 [Trametes versicolor]
MSSPSPSPTPRTIIRGRLGNNNLPRASLSRSPSLNEFSAALGGGTRSALDDYVVWDSPRTTLRPAFAQYADPEAMLGLPAGSTTPPLPPPPELKPAEWSDDDVPDLVSMPASEEELDEADRELPKPDKGKGREPPLPSEEPATPSPMPSTVIPESILWPSPASERAPDGHKDVQAEPPVPQSQPRRVIFSQTPAFGGAALWTRFKPGHLPEGGLEGKERFLEEEDLRRGRKRARPYTSPPPPPRFSVPPPGTVPLDPPFTPKPQATRFRTKGNGTPHPNRRKGVAPTALRETGSTAGSQQLSFPQPRTPPAAAPRGTRDLTENSERAQPPNAQHRARDLTGNRVDVPSSGPQPPLPPPLPRGAVIAHNYPPPGEEEYWVDMPDLDYGGIDLENIGGQNSNPAEHMDVDVPRLSRQMARAIYGPQYTPPFRDIDLSQARNEKLRASWAAQHSAQAGPSGRTTAGPAAHASGAQGSRQSQGHGMQRPGTPMPAPLSAQIATTAAARSVAAAADPPNLWNPRDDGEAQQIVQISHPDGDQRGMKPALPATGDFAFTPRPQIDGFPKVHFDEPDTLLRDLAKAKQDVLRRQSALSAVLLQIYNLRYPRQGQTRAIAVTLGKALTIITGQEDVHVLPPEADEQSQNPPATWAAVHLLPDSVARLLEGRVWSSRAITFIIYPCRDRIPTYVLTIAGFVHEHLIADTVKAHFEGPVILPAIQRYVSTNDKYAYFNSEAHATEHVLDSLQVRVEEISGDNVVARIYIESPTSTHEEWREWRDLIRSVHFTNDLDTTATARDNVYCDGCHGADHPTSRCPFQNVPAWNAPPAGGPFSNVAHTTAVQAASQQNAAAAPAHFANQPAPARGFVRGRGAARRGNPVRGKRGGRGQWAAGSQDRYPAY